MVAVSAKKETGQCVWTSSHGVMSGYFSEAIVLKVQPLKLSPSYPREIVSRFVGPIRFFLWGEFARMCKSKLLESIWVDMH